MESLPEKHLDLFSPINSNHYPDDISGKTSVEFSPIRNHHDSETLLKKESIPLSPSNTYHSQEYIPGKESILSPINFSNSKLSSLDGMYS